MNIFYGLFILISTAGVVYNAPSPNIQIESSIDIVGWLVYLCSDEEKDTASIFTLPTCNCLHNLIIEGAISFGPNNFMDFNEFNTEDNKVIPKNMGSIAPLEMSGSITIKDLVCIDKDENEQTLNNSRMYVLQVKVNNIYGYNSTKINFPEKDNPKTLEFVDEVKKGGKIRPTADITYIAPDFHTEESTVSIKLCKLKKSANDNERIVWSIVNMLILNGKGCPVEQGMKSNLPRDFLIQVPTDAPLKCGKYTVSITLQRANDELVAELFVEYTVSDGLDCVEE